MVTSSEHLLTSSTPKIQPSQAEFRRPSRYSSADNLLFSDVTTNNETTIRCGVPQRGVSPRTYRGIRAAYRGA